jgi:hypothetical protein
MFNLIRRSLPVLTVVAVVAVSDETVGETSLEFNTQRVVVFKDGHGLFVKEATGVADGEGRLFTEEVPAAAVLGTFWANAEGFHLQSMKAERVVERSTTTQETDTVTMLEILRANEGAEMVISTHDNRTITATLLDVLETPPPPAPEPPAPAPSHGHHTVALVATPVPVAGAGGQFVILAGAAGETVLPVSAIRSISGADLETRMVRESETVEETKRLTFQLEPTAAGREVTIRMLYFTPGIRWIPTYRLSGDLEEHGMLALQGEIINEVEDIEGAALDLVVGVPNFRYKSEVSPLSLERTLRSALHQAAPHLRGQQFSNASFAQRAGEWRGHHAGQLDDTGATAELAPDLAAGGEQDLFVYAVEEMSLAKGARASVALWESEVPLRHLYTFELAVVRARRSGSTRPPDPPAAGGFGAGFSAGEPSPLRLSGSRVWHQLELTNRTGVPWTTGPALLLKGFLPLGQELLTYTARGGSTLLPVTVAVDVRGWHEEREIERVPHAIKWGGYQWSKIRKSGTVTVTNYRDETIQTLVTLSVGGRVERASDEGVVKVDDMRAEDWVGGQAAINNHSDVRWELALEPGQTKTLTYEVSYYVR